MLAAASDTGVQGDGITSDTTPTITGTGTVGDTVTLMDGSTVIGSAVVAPDGTWSITSAALAPGMHSLTATQTEVAGNASAASPALSLTIDTAAPVTPGALALAAGSDSGNVGDNVTNVTTPTITGTGTAGDSVTLYDGNSVVGTETVAANGTWSITTGMLASGSNSLTAIQTDVAGNMSAASTALGVTIDSVPPAAPGALALASGSDSGIAGDGITNVSTPTITAPALPATASRSMTATASSAPERSPLTAPGRSPAARCPPARTA